MVATVSPPIGSEDVTTRARPATLDDASSTQDRRIKELEERVERQAVRRDGATLVMFAVSAMALVAGVLSVGLGMRAITESKHNATPAAPTAPLATIAAPHFDLTEFNVGLSTTSFAAGQHAVTISNSGTVPHELLVFRSDLDVSAYPVDAAGNIIEEGPGITLMSDGDNIDPGGSQDRTIDLTAPGNYDFVCNLPGHFKAGMFTQVTVG
jgi:uncharacterized cupredoxin-like copper-binding protein